MKMLRAEVSRNFLYKKIENEEIKLEEVESNETEIQYRNINSIVDVLAVMLKECNFEM